MSAPSTNLSISICSIWRAESVSTEAETFVSSAYISHQELSTSDSITLQTILAVCHLLLCPCNVHHFVSPDAWEQSFIVCLYKGKGDALDRGNYRGLKLTEQVMKVLERIVDSLIRQVVSIDESQFGFVPGRGTTDAIFVVRQLQEKYLAANKRLYMAFVDLEKAFDRVPRKVIRWAMRKLGVEEWIVRLVQSMYANARSQVRVGDGYSEEFEVKVGVHQGSVLSPLLFIVILEALSREL
ncbi:hypothetical protein EGW08_011785 [Elysia chlorotica]|uniref:Reverse transcriptase domain-containing protein n=1 Tax=Elysia chlorotica TaxID=188477 RepID=A0A3S1HJ50_ELYCH|nr:hypothetical protein EGW08_011785 [Elysia chlorotica]